MPLQHSILDSIPDADFVYMCPPCTSSNAAQSPPLRTYPDHPRGVPGLTGRRLQLVTDGNAHFDFCSEVIRRCNASRVPWAFESCAGRRYKDKAEWPLFKSVGFAWDYPPISRVLNDTEAVYHLSARCQWGAPYQKYTGHMTSSGPAAKAFGDVLSPAAECIAAVMWTHWYSKRSDTMIWFHLI